MQLQNSNNFGQSVFNLFIFCKKSGYNLIKMVYYNMKEYSKMYIQRRKDT